MCYVVTPCCTLPFARPACTVPCCAVQCYGTPVSPTSPKPQEREPYGGAQPAGARWHLELQLEPCPGEWVSVLGNEQEGRVDLGQTEGLRNAKSIEMRVDTEGDGSD